MNNYEKERGKGKTIGDLYERLGSIRESINEIKKGSNFEHRALLDEILTLRENKVKIQDLKEKVKELQNKYIEILSSPIDCEIVDRLRTGKILTFSELNSKLKMSKPTLSNHLKSLENKGIIKKKRKGRKVKYWLKIGK